MIGEGKATYQGETLDGAKALKRAGLKPVVLSSKEGIILLSGTTSVTAFASLAIYDAQGDARYRAQLIRRQPAHLR